MNQPEYILVDEIEAIVSAVKTSLALPTLNYQYGYVSELRETLAQMNDPAFVQLKYPLVWLCQPFTISRKDVTYYGDTSIRLFIIQESEKTLKANERMGQTFKPVIYPIYRALIGQIVSRGDLFDGLIGDHVEHSKTDRYYWGEEQAKALNDVFDCMEISNLKLKISNKQNCSIN